MNENQLPVRTRFASRIAMRMLTASMTMAPQSTPIAQPNDVISCG
jgi:hypothetical protein